jgi:hypothetical protein
VKAFSPATTDDLEDRVRIQTMAAKGANDSRETWGWFGVTGNPPPKVLAALYKKDPKYRKWYVQSYSGGRAVYGNSTNTSGDNPDWIFQIAISPNKANPNGSYDSQTITETVTVPNSPDLFPSFKQRTFTDQDNLLWPDLKGKKTDPSINTWVKNNLYGCGKSHTVSLEDYERSESAARSGGVCSVPESSLTDAERQVRALANCIPLTHH